MVVKHDLVLEEGEEVKGDLKGIAFHGQSEVLDGEHLACLSQELDGQSELPRHDEDLDCFFGIEELLMAV